MVDLVQKILPFTVFSIVSSNGLKLKFKVFFTFEASYSILLKAVFALARVIAAVRPLNFDNNHAKRQVNPINHFGVEIVGGFLFKAMAIFSSKVLNGRLIPTHKKRSFLIALCIN